MMIDEAAFDDKAQGVKCTLRGVRRYVWKLHVSGFTPSEIADVFKGTENGSAAAIRRIITRIWAEEDYLKW